MTTRLLFGSTLVLAGVVVLLALAAVPFEACVYAHGLYAENCTTTDFTGAGRALAAGLGTFSLVAGAWLSVTSVRGLRGNGHRA